MTATMMVDGRKRTPPVTLIHATAAPTGWLGAKVSTVVISPPKWHLKCEAMAVLVAQSPRAEPWTWAVCVEVTNPRASSPHSDAQTQLAGRMESVQSDLEDRCCQWSDFPFFVAVCFVLFVSFSLLLSLYAPLGMQTQIHSVHVLKLQVVQWITFDIK